MGDDERRALLYAALTVVAGLAVAYFGSGVLAAIWLSSRLTFCILIFCFYFGVLLFWLFYRQPSKDAETERKLGRKILKAMERGDGC